MKKYQISIREKLTYTKGAIVKVPKTMKEGELNRLLNNLQGSSDSSGDLPFAAERMGVDLTLVNPNDWSSPDRSEIEIEEYNEIKD